MPNKRRQQIGAQRTLKAMFQSGWSTNKLLICSDLDKFACFLGKSEFAFCVCTFHCNFTEAPPPHNLFRLQDFISERILKPSSISKAPIFSNRKRYCLCCVPISVFQCIVFVKHLQKHKFRNVPNRKKSKLFIDNIGTLFVVAGNAKGVKGDAEAT